MSIEVMKRIKSLLQDGDKIDSHTISAVVAECDMVILAKHPAPSTHSIIEKAISSGYFGVLPIKATIPMCKAGWAASGGELTFQQIGHIYEEMYKARPLPAADIDVAKEAPGLLSASSMRFITTKCG